MNRPFPRVTTRGHYDLHDGSTLKTGPYFLYPKKFFDTLDAPEITIMIHGLRNDNAGAVEKFKIARRRLAQLRYRYPVVGFSYDANTHGAHVAKSALKALVVGEKIARKNGGDMARFVLDFKKVHPETRIRLMGHSLGSKVILYTIQRLAREAKLQDVLESVYFFGSPITVEQLTSPKHVKMFQRMVAKKVVNYYSPADDVLRWAHEQGHVVNPIGYVGASPRGFSKYVQKKVAPKNHRFRSYAAVIRSFP